MKRIILLLLIALITCSHNAYSAEPFTTLKNEIDKVFSILSDPAYSDESKKAEEHEKLWKIVEDAFDFKIMARLTLANNWRSFSPEQQDEFVRVFGKFLGNTYLDKIQSGFSGEKVEYDGQEMLSGNRALVKTNITHEGVKTPVNYNMLKTGDSWKIYDVKIEGVSLLQNYRTQFSSILMRGKPEDLIEMLKKKI